MLYLPFPILIVIALACWLLSRRVPTRWLGTLAALASLVALSLVLMSRWERPLPIFSEPHTWAEARGFSVIAGLQVDGLNLLLSLALLGGGGLCLWSLARSLSPALYGYGGLFSALLLMLTGGLLALFSADLLLLVFGWGVVILGGALARRASGIDDERPTAVAAVLQPGGLLLLGAVVLFGLDRANGGGGLTTSTLSAAPVSMPVFAAWLAAVAAAMGLPLFDRPAGGDGRPLQLQGLLLACGLPLFAGYSLLRLFSLSGFASSSWPPLYYQLLLALGAVSVLCCSAAALQSRGLGAILSWQLSAQLGLMLLALGVGKSSALVASIALLINASLTTLIGGIALAALARYSSSEDLAFQPRLSAALVLPGIAYGVAAASAVGFPPFWGFWARLWLLQASEGAPWLLPLVLLSSMLLALTYMGPLALFWRRAAGQPEQPAERAGPLELPLCLLTLALALAGLLPTQVWRLLLRAAALDTLPTGPGGNMSLTLPSRLLEVGMVGIALLLTLWTWWQSRRRQQAAFHGGELPDPDDGTPLVPVALGYILRGLALLARPVSLHRALGSGLQAMSEGLSWSLQIVSGRYYLPGILMVMVILLILMIA